MWPGGSLAVGETVIMLHRAPPLYPLLKHLLKGRGGVQQNDSLADGYQEGHVRERDVGFPTIL